MQRNISRREFGKRLAGGAALLALQPAWNCLAARRHPCRRVTGVELPGRAWPRRGGFLVSFPTWKLNSDLGSCWRAWSPCMLQDGTARNERLLAIPAP